uniref:WD40 repeat domain-containing protein n=1 Tax=Herbidospora sakaeratensis TaxID=564415 RepID=UPI000783267D|nr:hypothetical protein [Herbidospora sakaeratensis]
MPDLHHEWLDRYSDGRFAAADPEIRAWVAAVHAARLGAVRPEQPGGGWRIVRSAGIQENRHVRAPWNNQTGAVTAVAAGLLDGVPVAVTGSDHGVLRAWDLRTGLPLGEQRVDAHDIGSIAVMDEVVVATDWAHLFTWHPRTGETTRERHWGVGQAATVRDAGKWHLLLAQQGRVRIRGPRGPWRRIGHPGDTSAATIRVDGRRRVVVGGDTTRVYDLRTGEPCGGPMGGHTRALAVAHVAGRPVVVVAGHDDTVRLWDLRTGAPRGRPRREPVTTLATAEVGGRAVGIGGAPGRRTRVWNLRTGVDLGTLGEAGRAVAAVGHQAVTCSSHGVVRVWDLRTLRGTPLPGHPRVGAAALAGDGVFYAWEEGMFLAAENLADGESSPLKHALSAPGVSAVTTVPGAVVTSWWRDGALRVHDLETGERRVLAGHSGPVHALAAEDGTVVSGGLDGMIGIWDVATGSSRSIVSPCAVDALTVSGGRIFACGADGVTRLFDLRTEEALGALPTGVAHAIDVQDRTALVGGADLRVWDLRERAGRRLRGHAGAVTAVALRGGRAVSGGWDHTLRTWDLRTGEEVAPPVTFPWPVSALAWHPAGRLVAGMSWEVVVLEPSEH